MHTLSPDKEPIAVLVTLDALYLRPLPPGLPSGISGFLSSTPP